MQPDLGHGKHLGGMARRKGRVEPEDPALGAVACEALHGVRGAKSAAAGRVGRGRNDVGAQGDGVRNRGQSGLQARRQLREQRVSMGRSSAGQRRRASQGGARGTGSGRNAALGGQNAGGGLYPGIIFRHFNIIFGFRRGVAARHRLAARPRWARPRGRGRWGQRRRRATRPSASTPGSISAQPAGSGTTAAVSTPLRCTRQKPPFWSLALTS